ncbi:PDZ domain-containing protein [Helicobacter valdiviensis]|uniref:PDZ domain-containing protein n=1 Tax=Helicobacter valdiviensis TaxID=1458358 RepID=A0A2W6MXJ9_9HELI|nr:PDZ domain-containing protein [Helicobacter valdiviensis]PZT47918.1 PDZ domain-containing protein [Helicobacter valdiviensis]
MLKKILLSSLATSLFVFGYDFSACSLKAKDSLEPINKSYGIAIAPLYEKDLNKTIPIKSKLFMYSPNETPKGYKILKHDPFLGMYLLESKSNLKPIKLLPISNAVLEEEMASITPKDNVSGKFQSFMQSPRSYATLNVPTFKNSLISTICDNVYGIGIGEGKFIDKKYLERFLNSKEIYYGDIGIRVKQNQEDFVEVSVIDPFFPKNPFQYGDIILTINNEAIPNTQSFDRVVFDLKQGSQVPIKIKREGATLEIMALVDKRRGGMLLKEDFLGRIGISITPDFTITSVSNFAQNGFERLKVGDKVLRINQKEVPNGMDNIIHLLGEFASKPQKWLISRNDFQFFILVNEEN